MSNNPQNSDLSQIELIECLQHLREARAMLSRDVEAFHEATLTLEKIAHIGGASVGNTLWGCRTIIVSLAKGHSPEQKTNAAELFDTVHRARNMAVHSGAWVPHHSSRLVDLFLLLEEAILSKMDYVEQAMVRDPVQAKPWHRVAHARNAMLSNAFSALPIAIEIDGKEQWMLLCDHAIVRMVTGTSSAYRSKLLSYKIEQAVRSEDLKLEEPGTCRARDRIEAVAGGAEWPLLVIDKENGVERLLGILTPFDLL